MRALEMYRAFAEEDLALPVIAGEKPENERFPGAVETWSIEAMMQDGKALQAGTSHYLGTNFAACRQHPYQDREGAQQLCHTTSWGVSTRMVGGVIMTHGDDDGLRVPPALAPYQVVILPMLRDKPRRCRAARLLRGTARRIAAARRPGRAGARAARQAKPGKAAAKRWDWVRKGAPLIVEVGSARHGKRRRQLLRRDALWNTETGKPAFQNPDRDLCAQTVPTILADIQNALLVEARERREANIRRDIDDMDALAEHFSREAKYPGWVEVQWSRPTGDGLARIVERLKELRLTLRNVPLNAPPADGTCIFTGEQAVERVFVARAY